jgi:CO/xanthine dehydrogenase Mo-binding subunit
MTHLGRRALLRAAAGLVVAFSLPTGARASERTVAGDEVDGFLAIAADGAVTIYAGKVDLGTGARAALRQIVAEELGVGFDRIALVEGDTALTPDQGSTGGSTGIAVGGVRIRQAAATAREKLLALAAERLQRPVAALEAADGRVRPRDGGGPGLGFGDLIGGRAFALKVDASARLKDPADYRIVGKSIPRPDLPGKFTGRHVYVQDFRLDGMLHGRVIRPPAVGAELLSVDEASVAAIAGAKVVRVKNYLGVVAPTEWAAVRAARALKAHWSDPAALAGADDLFATVRATEVDHEEVLRHVGDPASVLAASPRRLEATYQWPIQSHASMGPSCAVADVRSDSATIWTASQGTHKSRQLFSGYLGLPPDKVRLIYLDGSGSYGSNGNDDVAADAALLSRAAGKPVRVQWMREDEHGWDPKGPPQLLDLRAALDPSGEVTAWETVAYLPVNTKGLPGLPLLAWEAAGLAQPGGMISGLTNLNSDPPYGIANMRAVTRWLRATPLRPSNLRAPGKIGNVFAVESFADELADAAGVDPLEFRLRGLREPRGLAVLRRVAEAMAWSPRPRAVDPSAEVLGGRGIAYVHYKQAENFVAMGLEATVERASGTIRVTRVVCAHDCGLMINPDAVRAQVEGCILQTLSRTLFEQVTFDRSRVTSTDWASYPILGFADVPALEIHLIDRPNEKPLGAGEAAAAPVAAALGNAVFDAAGIRLRTVPFTPERVKQALQSAAT